MNHKPGTVKVFDTADEVAENFAQMVIKFSCAHFLLEFWSYQYFSELSVGFHQDIFVIKKDVINSRYALVPQINVIDHMAAPEHRQIERVMYVVIHIRARGDKPVNKTVVHQGNYC